MRIRFLAATLEGVKTMKPEQESLWLRRAGLISALLGGAGSVVYLTGPAPMKAVLGLVLVAIGLLLYLGGRNRTAT